jgi:hypothetical protein
MRTNTKKIIGWIVAGLVVLGAGFLAYDTYAVTPSQYNLTEGNTISATNSSDPDVYIINDSGYKRLFINPEIFGMYGHLGGFANVKSVTPEVRDTFPTSGLFKLDGSEKVYGLEVTGEDAGILHWINISGQEAVNEDANFFQKVFVINANEFNWYQKGSNYNSLSEVPNYARGGVITPVVTNSVTNLTIDSTTVTSNAQGFKVLSVRFNGDGNVNSLNVKKQGIFDSNKKYI